MAWYRNLQFLNDWKSTIFELLAAPGALETLAKGGGRSHPPFGRVSGAAGAAQPPKMIDLQSLFFKFVLGLILFYPLMAAQPPRATRTRWGRRPPPFLDGQRTRSDLLHFGCCRGFAVLKSLVFRGLNGPLIPGSLEKMGGGVAPHLFRWVSR